MQSDASAYELKSERNITPFSGSMSTAASLVLIHENAQPRPVDCFDALVDVGSCKVSCTSSYRQLSLPYVVLYLPKLFIIPLQLLLVDPVTFDLGHGALVVEVVYGVVNLGMKVMVILKELELARGVSAEGSSGGEGSRLERLDVLIVVPVYHAVYQWVFTIFDFDVLGWHYLPSGEANVEGDVVSAFV